MNKIELHSFKNGKLKSIVDVKGWTVQDIIKFCKVQRQNGFKCKTKRIKNANN